MIPIEDSQEPVILDIRIVQARDGSYYATAEGRKTSLTSGAIGELLRKVANRIEALEWDSGRCFDPRDPVFLDLLATGEP